MKKVSALIGYALLIISAFGCTQPEVPSEPQVTFVTATTDTLNVTTLPTATPVPATPTAVPSTATPLPTVTTPLVTERIEFECLRERELKLLPFSGRRSYVQKESGSLLSFSPKLLQSGPHLMSGLLLDVSAPHMGHFHSPAPHLPTVGVNSPRPA